MVALSHTPANQRKIEQIKQVVNEDLEEGLQRGFHGTITIKVSIQDGTIQQIRHRVERIER